MDSDEDWDPTMLKGYMVGKCGNSIMCTNFFYYVGICFPPGVSAQAYG